MPTSPITSVLLPHRNNRTYVPYVRWEQHGTDRWLGFVDGRQVGYVGEVVTDGGARHYWLAWLQDDTAQGQVVGRFDTAEEAMTATDAAV